MELTVARALNTNTVMNDLRSQWEAQLSATSGFDLDEYAPGLLPHAEKIAEEAPAPQNNGTFALMDKRGVYHALFHANRAMIKPHQGWTLRVHWILAAPKYDVTNVSPDELADLAAGIFYGAYELKADPEFAADRVKIHLSNVGDRRFVIAMAYGLRHINKDISVDMAGNWLLIEG